MAIGIRITSENLVGQTASITFQSVTGGTPIDLGIQTIPFNYYNVLPYGEYTISSTTYNYAYTLSVSQPEGQNQNYAFLGNVSGETNYSVGLLNFNNFTSEIIDLGVDSSYWGTWNWYELSESGSMYLFSNNGDNARLAIFTDKNGFIVDQYSAITTNYNYDNLDGRITYFLDNTNGVFKWFDGQTIHMYTFTSGVETIDVQYDWDSTCLDNTFIFILRNTGTTTDTSYKVSSNGSVNVISDWDYSHDRKHYGTYYSSNYFYELSYLVSDTTLTSIKIYDTSGTLLFNPTISLSTYDSWNISWYGYAQFNLVLWNNLNSSIDWLILNYDTINDSYVNTGHLRGSNYSNVTTQYRSLWNSNDVPVGGMFILFYGNTDNFIAGGGYEINYLDIVYKLENNTEFETYTYTNTGDYSKLFNIYGYAGKDFYTFCSTGDSISSVFSITQNGVKITQLPQNINDVTNTNTYAFGDYFQIINFTNSNSTGEFNLFLNGDLIDSLSLNTAEDWYTNTDYDVCYISDSISSSYYINNQVTGYTEMTGIINNLQNTYSYYSPQHYFAPGQFLLFKDITFMCRVLTKDRLYNEFSLPITLSKGIGIGRDNIIYVYNNQSGDAVLNLYDFNGSLLNSVNTGINGWSEIYAGKDRYVLTQDTIDGQKSLTMITSEGSKQITIDDQFINWTNINDYILND